MAIHCNGLTCSKVLLSAPLARQSIIPTTQDLILFWIHSNLGQTLASEPTELVLTGKMLK